MLAARLPRGVLRPQPRWSKRTTRNRSGLKNRQWARLAPLPGLRPEAHRLAAVMVAVGTLWVSEALPLPVSALGGAAACVLLQVAPAKEVFAPFADPLMFLFIGSFVLSQALYYATGAKLGNDADAWRSWWKDAKVHFDFEAAAEQREKAREAKEAKEAAKDAAKEKRKPKKKDGETTPGDGGTK